MPIKIKKKDYLIAISVLIIYTGIGYLFNIDVLKIFIIKTDGFSISILGVVICILTIIVIEKICRKKSSGY